VARRTAVVEGPPIHGAERRREIAGEDVAFHPVHHAGGQSTASTKAEWYSSVDGVRWFCDPMWLFAADSFDGPKAGGKVALVPSEASIPHGLLNYVTM
jgi:hypothetical protein